MYDLFKKYPSAIENTLKIAESCDVDIPLGEIPYTNFNSRNLLTLQMNIWKIYV